MSRVPLPLLLLAACQDSGLTVHNSDPEATIVNPASGTEVMADQSLALNGVVSDAETATGQLVISWTSTLSGSLDGELQLDGSAVLYLVEDGLEEGEHTIELAVFDEEGASATDSVQIVATANQAPEVEWVSPTEDDPVVTRSPLTLLATVYDEDALEDMFFTWSSDVEGQLDGEQQISGDVLSFYVEDGLGAGEHQLTLQAIDSFGETGADSVVIGVSDEVNTAPSASIMQPGNGDVFKQSDQLVFIAVVTDAESPTSDITCTWSTNLAGLITGSEQIDGTMVTFTVEDELDVGGHNLQLDVVDPSGAMDSDYVTINIVKG